MSRAYYACYHTIRSEVHANISIAMRQQSGLGGKIVDHGKLCLALKACIATATVGIRLEQLKAQRHWADYDLSRAVNARDADTALGNAKDILSDLNRLGGASAVILQLRTHLQSIHGTL